MENETLFNEDAEPPGTMAGLVVVQNEATNFFLSPTDHQEPSPAKSKPERLFFPFKDSPRAKAFRKKHYPDISRIEWFDWRWQLQNAIRDVEALDNLINLSDNERQAMMHPSGDLPVAITPYYASLLDPQNPAAALRRCVVPVVDECLHTKGEEEDPLCEDADSPVPGIIHRYPDRVLFLVTDICATYCRYCTRSRIFGRHHQCFIDTAKWERALAYIESNPNIRDVLLSGGDPLTLSDDKLEWLLSRLKRHSAC